MRNRIGQAVEGDDRFPRPQLEEKFDTAVQSGCGATLFSLRRIGKSSEVKALQARLREKTEHVLYLDAQGIPDEISFLNELFKMMQKEAPPLSRRLIQFLNENPVSIELMEILNRTLDILKRDNNSSGRTNALHLQSISKEMLHLLKESPNKPIVIVDEFPWFCKRVVTSKGDSGLDRLETLLSWMRRWRGEGGMRMLLTGSFGLAGVLRKYNVDRSGLNDLSELHVPPLTEDEAKNFLRMLAEGESSHGWTEEHTDRVLQGLGEFYPLSLQTAFQHMHKGGSACPVCNIEAIFCDGARSACIKPFSDQFSAKSAEYREYPKAVCTFLHILLKAVLGGSQEISTTDLAQLCPSPDDPLDRTDIADALDILREDGFITVRDMENGDRLWRPSSRLASIWWTNR